MTKGQLLRPIYDESKEHEEDDGNDNEEEREKVKKI